MFVSVCKCEEYRHQRCNDDAKMLNNTKLECAAESPKTRSATPWDAIEMKRNSACNGAGGDEK